MGPPTWLAPIMGRNRRGSSCPGLLNLARACGARESAASPVEKLPQDLVHWLTVLLGGRIARRRGRGGLGRGGLGRRGLGRRLGGRGAARDAALAARPAAALALALAEAAQALLQEIAEGLAELAAERTAGCWACRACPPAPPCCPPAAPAVRRAGCRSQPRCPRPSRRTGPCPSPSAWHRRRRDCRGCPASPDRSVGSPTGPRSSRGCRARPDRWRGPGLRWSSRALARRGTRSAWCRDRWCLRRSS